VIVHKRLSLRIQDLRTPAALVDLGRLEANAERMAQKASRLGVALRPHVKTHKCVEIGRIQSGGTPGPITVSTLAEARGFAEAGFGDITYAVPLPLPYLPDAAELGRRIRLNLLLDDEATLAPLEAFAKAQRTRFRVFLKVDCGYHRAGVDPRSDGALTLARRLQASPGVEFLGILTHAGQSYACRSRQEAKAVAEQERSVMDQFARRLRQSGIPVGSVSVGSTPTCCAAEGWARVTEIRPGNYVFFDAFQAAIGSCEAEDALAFSVLATVIGHYPGRNELLLNAGALALCKDPGPVHVDPHCGFGRLYTAEGLPLRHLRLSSLSQEHGLVQGLAVADYARLPVGSCLRVVPNHSCLAAACFDRYVVLKEGAVSEEWRRIGGW
jgi:D-serine deaminase-like pyridoxal phosphate-dependent protein